MAMGREKNVGTCRYCGCTAQYRCPVPGGGGCDWADDEHECCTLCEDAALDMGLAALESLVSAEGLISRRPGGAPPVATAPAAPPVTGLRSIQLGGPDDPGDEPE